MEKVVYIILSRDKDQFRPTYAGVCEQTHDRAFFTSMDSFKCWISMAGSEQNLYLAILPMFESDEYERRRITDRVITALKPSCN